MEEIPHTVFLIPYRDREKQAKYFIDYFNYYVKAQPNMSNGVKYFFCHQNDTRPFNRGAMKNIGFLTVKKLYPDNWKDITLVFHDIDCYPRPHVKLPYTTPKGTVTHYYGFIQTLGGIVVINAEDFAEIGGYPNFWGWGYEDNTLQMRVDNKNLKIDRSLFFNVNDMGNFNRLDKCDEKKIVSPDDSNTFARGVPDTYNHIDNLVTNIDTLKCVITVNYFTADLNAPKHSDLKIYDLRGKEPNLYKYLNERGNYKSGRNWKLTMNK